MNHRGWLHLRHLTRRRIAYHRAFAFADMFSVDSRPTLVYCVMLHGVLQLLDVEAPTLFVLVHDAQEPSIDIAREEVRLPDRNVTRDRRGQPRVAHGLVVIRGRLPSDVRGRRRVRCGSLPAPLPPVRH